MCGILSVIGKTHLSHAELKALKELFVVTTLRGIDSTGIMHADTLEKHQYHLLKDVGNFYDCVGDPSHIERLKTNIVMGHSRWATQGNVTQENAHPYEFSNFIGMHNGTLDEPDFMPSSIQNDAHKERTDSWIFFKKLDDHLEKGGSIAEFTKDLTWWCAYAMILWDYKDTVTVFRDYQRPLSIGVEKTSGTVFIASEKRFLEFIQNKNISLDIHEVKTGVLYEIDQKRVGFDDKPWTETELPESHWSSRSFMSRSSGIGFTNPQSKYYDMYEQGDLGVADEDGWYFDNKYGCWRNRHDTSIVV